MSKKRSERSKTKLRTKLGTKKKSLKVHKILLRPQLQLETQPLRIHVCTIIQSKFSLNFSFHFTSLHFHAFQDLLARFRHHNSTVRRDALRQLTNILLRKSLRSHSQLNSLLRGIAALSLDKVKDVRASSYRALDFILRHISSQHLIPLCQVLTSYLSCAMTHIDPCVKEDSLLFLDVLVQNCDSVLARESYKILPNFLSMICRLHNEIRPGTRLTTTLNSKSTNVKWRIKVLERLANMFISIVNYNKFYVNTQSNELPISRVKKYARYIPIYSNDYKIFEINLDKDLSSIGSCMKEPLPIKEFMKYVGLLMPLMSDIWLEVCPDGKVESYTEITISNEAAALLKNIVVIVQSIVEYIDILDHDDYSIDCMRQWFKDTFHDSYMKNFLSKFPYAKVKPLINECRKHQRDFSQMDFTDRCLEHNLGLCQIHVWFTSLFNRNEQFPKSTKTYCISILNYLNSKLISI